MIQDHGPSHRCTSVIAFLFAMALTYSPCLSADAQPKARLTDGSSRAATLNEIDADWRLKFTGREDKKLFDVPAKDLIAWGAPNEAERGAWFLLADGGLIVGDLLRTKDGVAVVDSATLGELKVPLSRLRGIVFTPPAKRLGRDRLEAKLRSARADADEVWMLNDDRLRGSVASISEEKIELLEGERNVDLPLENAAAIVFDSAVVEPTPHKGLGAAIGLADGSLIVADRCEPNTEGDRIKLTSGKLSVTIPLSKIVFVQPFGGRAMFLSDLKAAGYRHIPLLDLKWDYKTDANVLGGKLRSGGRISRKGLGVHSASVLTYRVPEGARRLIGRVGIDDSTASGGSVIFRVFVDDGSGKWKPKFASKVVRGGNDPLDLSIDLTGVRQVSLMVDFAGPWRRARSCQLA